MAKEFAEEAPPLFLELLGIAPAGVLATLTPLRTETAPPVSMPDYVARLSVPGERIRTFHVEFVVRFRKGIPRRMAKYGGSLAWQYRRPVQSILLIMCKEGASPEIPKVGKYQVGGTKVIHPFRTVQLWELDPGPLLARNDPKLLPWALLMRLGREEAVRLGAIVSNSGDEESIARFLTLGSLRYDRDDLQQMVGGAGMTFERVIIEGSSLFREARARAIAAGKAEGKAEGALEGQASEARRLLRLALADRFPGLEKMSEIDRIQDVTDLETLLLRHVICSQDRDSVSSAIVSAAAMQ